jgi:hypothetical protein
MLVSTHFSYCLIYTTVSECLLSLCNGNDNDSHLQVSVLVMHHIEALR